MCGGNSTPFGDVPTFDEEYHNAVFAPDEPTVTVSESLYDRIRNAADEVELLTRERDDFEQRVHELEQQISDAEDAVDFDELERYVSEAQSDLSSALSEAEDLASRILDLRYVDLEDVMDEVDRLSSAADSVLGACQEADSSLDRAIDAVRDAA